MLMRPVRSTAGTDEDPQNSSGRAPFHSRSPVCQLSHSGLQATPIPFPLVKSDLIDDAGVGYFLGATFFFLHILPLQQVHAESQHSPLFSIFAGGGCRSAAYAGRLAIISSLCGCIELCALDAPSIFYMPALGQSSSH